MKHHSLKVKMPDYEEKTTKKLIYIFNTVLQYAIGPSGPRISLFAVNYFINRQFDYWNDYLGHNRVETQESCLIQSSESYVINPMCKR